MLVIKKLWQYINQGSVYIPSLRELFNFIVLNENPFGGHLWYLGAYLYVLLIAMIISKYKIWKYMFYAIPILLLTDLILGKYSLLFLDREFPVIYVRNFLFVGLPYFALGAFYSH